LIKGSDEYGQIKYLPAIFFAWHVLNFRKMPPVDLFIPLPELFSRSKKRGFWFALLLVKKWSRLTRTPYNKDLIRVGAPGTKYSEINMPLYYLDSRNLNTDLLQNKRIAIVMPLMQSERVLHVLASHLKNQGVRWVAYWCLTRKSKKDYF
jgi:predicted amidophosphoribosyltransferase